MRLRGWFKMKLVLLVCIVGGCLGTEPRRDTTSVCVEMQGRLDPGAHGRDDHGRQGMMGGQYQQPYQQQFPPGPPQGMPQQGMHPQGMPQQGMHPPGMQQQGMHPPGMQQQGMHPPGMPPHGMPPMFMPPQFRGRMPMPPQMDPIMIIKRLEDECAAKDHQIAELKSIINQHDMPPKQDYHHQTLPPQPHRQPEH